MPAERAAVTDYTRDRIWQEMLDVARYVHYYEALTNRWSWYDKGLRASMLVGASLSIAALADVLPAWSGICAAVFLIVATVFDFIWSWGVKASLAHAINLECNMVDNEYAALWTQIRADQISDHEAQSRSNQLLARIMAATAQLTETNRRLNRKAQESAYKVVADRWSAAAA